MVSTILKPSQSEKQNEPVVIQGYIIAFIYNPVKAVNKDKEDIYNILHCRCKLGFEMRASQIKKIGANFAVHAHYIFTAENVNLVLNQQFVRKMSYIYSHLSG